ncbi:1D-myo-inositol 2-acetamido-2-deoxy-alpha-D-glucopyranoside deacetylase [Thalassoglobus neptunius]|uniref:1D-myo-inositol 2-acetamido-2-deoxy-alpha-D-glucopyranoside deacetylase n=1 Tax=Thalassoglobus neptunius TaxID=1938619 RepID=A0A5C5WNP5_9PLAN|nr:bacillithiol biosynthesis deacetylase BshB1 [Thalassoglobus neptunius]TWT52227.1 1D-myo-inositol 2-acetamido-2-deoxy-alpha-D-glucopyranoside deacetylase [Thalassoglobus neptunius]
MDQLAESLDVLVVAPHPDDAEISVGGTILKTLSQGKRVGVVELTNGEPTPRGSVERRQQETDRSTEVLGLTQRFQLNLPNRSLTNDLDGRRKLAGIFRKTRPKVILAPYWEDAHPDHVAASALADAARFWAKLSRSDLPGDPFHPPKIFYYWSIHLRIHPKPAFVVDISDHIDQKIESVRCYESQVIEGRSTEFPTLLDDIRDRARYWGWTIERAFGEPFASREEIRMDDITTLV